MFNYVNLIGYLGGDAQSRSTRNNSTLCRAIRSQEASGMTPSSLKFSRLNFTPEVMIRRLPAWSIKA